MLTVPRTRDCGLKKGKKEQQERINSALRSSLLYYQLPAFLYAILIFIVSSIPYATPPPLGVVYQDKWIHLLEYGALGFLVARALYHQTRYALLRRRWFRMTILITFLYGVSDELHQWFVPGRHADGIDVLADGLGGLLGAYLFLKLRRRLSS